MKNGKVEEVHLNNQSPQSRKAKTRQVTSRFLSPSSVSLPPDTRNDMSSTNKALSPVLPKKPQNRHHPSLQDLGFIKGKLWPSSSPASSSSSDHTNSNKNKNLGTLADHLGNERLKDYLLRKTKTPNTDQYEKSNSSSVFLGRQRSCTEFRRFENDKESNSKENHGPILGGSMRYTGRVGHPDQKTSTSNQTTTSVFVPPRLSVDENALCRKNSRRKSDSFKDTLYSGSEYSDSSLGYTDLSAPATAKTSPVYRKAGKDVSSRYMNDAVIRTHQRGASDSEIPNPLSTDDSSSSLKRLTLKNAIKRANSLTRYKSSKSQWALSPGRSESPPLSVENKEKLVNFYTMKPPTSPSKVKGVEKFLNLGLDLFKSKKSSSSSPLGGYVDLDGFHELRLLDNRFIQWRFANARADVVNTSQARLAEGSILCARSSLAKLRQSVIQKKLQFEKEKLDMKLNLVLFSQIKLLEAWGDMEKQHISAISVTTNCLHSVVCRVPLIEGAKADSKSVSIALRHAYDLTASIKSVLTSFSPLAETAELLSALAEVVAQQRLLLEECFELFRTISTLELQEISLKCCIIQSRSRQQQISALQQQQI